MAVSPSWNQGVSGPKKGLLRASGRAEKVGSGSPSHSARCVDPRFHEEASTRAQCSLPLGPLPKDDGRGDLDAASVAPTRQRPPRGKAEVPAPWGLPSLLS